MTLKLGVMTKNVEKRIQIVGKIWLKSAVFFSILSPIRGTIRLAEMQKILKGNGYENKNNFICPPYVSHFRPGRLYLRQQCR